MPASGVPEGRGVCVCSIKRRALRGPLPGDRSLRERSEERDPVPDSRTRSDERRRLGFAGVPTMAFYPDLDPPAPEPEPAAAPERSEGPLVTHALCGAAQRVRRSGSELCRAGAFSQSRATGGLSTRRQASPQYLNKRNALAGRRRTPILAVGTDPKMLVNSQRKLLSRRLRL
jgi:hypothetical protein